MNGSTTISQSPGEADGKTRRSSLRFQIASVILPLVLVALVGLFSYANATFHETGNLLDIARSSATSVILLLGVTWVLASGHTDLSFPDVAALSGMLLAALIQAGYSVSAAVGLALLLATGIGLINGVLVGLLGFPALITTVATAGLARALAIILGSGQPIYLNGTGVLADVVNANPAGVPLPAIVALLLCAVAWIVQERTLFGHYVFAMEQNSTAVAQAGIPLRQIGFCLFALSGLFAALAGLIVAVSLNSGQPMVGNSFFLDGLTAVLLGAMVIRHGQPNIIGTVVGVLILAVLLNGLSLLGWPTHAREIIKGVLLLAGVAIAVRGKRLG